MNNNASFESMRKNQHRFF